MRPRAWIVNIGTELVIGRIVNTNGAWLARELTLRGVEVKRIIVVPDDEEEVVGVLQRGARLCEIIVTTGGLGPTYDDRTAEFIAKAFGRKLVLNAEALRMVEEKYRAAGMGLTEDRVKMAYMPEGAKPIPNPVGTAPGIYLEMGKCRVIALPGVPREAEEMFRRYAVKLLEPILPRLCVVERGTVVRGLPESSLAPILKELARKYPTCYIKSHPKGSEVGEPVVEVKVLTSAPTCDEAEKVVSRVLGELKERLGSVVG